jgi:hypothetical protein
MGILGAGNTEPMTPHGDHHTEGHNQKLTTEDNSTHNFCYMGLLCIPSPAVLNYPSMNEHTLRLKNLVSAELVELAQLMEDEGRRPVAGKIRAFADLLDATL